MVDETVFYERPSAADEPLSGRRTMSVVDTARTIGELIKSGATIGLQEKIVQLREEALELLQENLHLKQENSQLKEQLKWKEVLHRRRELYWSDGDDTPFCPYCWEKHKLVIHLSRYADPESTRYECQECRTVYEAARESDFRVTSSRVS